MAYYAPKTVDVNVFLSTAPSQIKGFDVVGAIVGSHKTTVIDTYLDSKSLLSDGYAVNSPAYIMAQGVFNGGIAAPSQFKVIGTKAKTYTITINADQPIGTKVSVNTVVNGVAKVVECSVSNGKTAKNSIATDLATALTTAYQSSEGKNPTFAASENVVTATVSTQDGAYPCSFGWSSTTGLEPHVTIGSTSDTEPSKALASALGVDDNISFIITEFKASSKLTPLAKMMKENKLQLFVSTGDADSKDNSKPTSIAHTLKALEINEVSLQWSKWANTYFPEAAFLGSLAGLKPYNLYNPSGWTLNGVPKDDQLTEQERITLASRNTNFYVTERGVGVYKDGYAISGEFVDTIRFAVWSEVTVEQVLFDLKKRQGNLGKTIPYADFGASMMEAAVYKDYVNVGIRGGRIATGVTEDEFGNTISLEPIVDFGTRAQQTDADITNRIWRNGVIEVVMLSGVNYIETNIYILSNRQFEI